MKNAFLLSILAVLLFYPSTIVAGNTQQTVIKKLKVNVEHNGEFDECLLHIQTTLDTTLVISGNTPCKIRYSLWRCNPYEKSLSEMALDGETTMELNENSFCQTTLHVEGIRCWNSEEPYRYTFKAEIIRPDNQVVQEKEITIALSDCRIINMPPYSDEFNIGGNCLCYNGEIIRMKGISFSRTFWKKHTSSCTTMKKLAEQLKQLHVNAVAFPVIGSDACRQWLATCDSFGLYAIPYMSSLRDTSLLSTLTHHSSLGIWMTDKKLSQKQTARLTSIIKANSPKQQLISPDTCSNTTMLFICDPTASDADKFIQREAPCTQPYCFLFEEADTSIIDQVMVKVLSNNVVGSIFVDDSYLTLHPDWVARLYQPFSINMIAPEKGYISVKNLQVFTAFTHGIINASVLKGKHKIWEKQIELSDITPREIKTIHIPYESAIDKNSEYQLQISITENLQGNISNKIPSRQSLIIPAQQNR